MTKRSETDQICCRRATKTSVKNYVEDPGNGSEYKRIIRDTLRGWNNEAAEKIAQLAGRSVNARNINAFLAGKLENLPIDRSKVASASELSSIQGKAKTIRKGLRQRLSDHNAALNAFNDIGLAVDLRMAEAIPKWDKRAAAMARREQSKQGPEPEMAKGGRVHISNNLDTVANADTAPVRATNREMRRPSRSEGFFHG